MYALRLITWLWSYLRFFIPREQCLWTKADSERADAARLGSLRLHLTYCFWGGVAGLVCFLNLPPSLLVPALVVFAYFLAGFAYVGGEDFYREDEAALVASQGVMPSGLQVYPLTDAICCFLLVAVLRYGFLLFLWLHH
jgi:hypothetical protein